MIVNDGKFCYRARLVARGFNQKEAVDYDDTFSPVVRHSTLRLLIAFSVKYNLSIIHLDVKTAFLNGFLDKIVFMKQPEGFIMQGCEDKVCKLNKAIYGLKQSSRAWNTRINDFLLDIGYVRSNYEPCLYIKKENEKLTYIALYVDDFFIFSNNENEVERVKKELSSNFKIKDLGEAKNCLGMKIIQDKEKGIIKLSQKNYIDAIVKRFNMSECKTVKTPMDVNSKFEDENLGLSNNSNFPYRNLIGNLMYLVDFVLYS